MEIIKPNGDVVKLSVEEYKTLENNTKVSVPKVESKVEPLLIVPKRQYKQRRAKWDRWTDEEDKVLKSHHSKNTMKRLLPHRTNMAINTRIKVLRGKGIKIVLEHGRTKHKQVRLIKPTDGRINMMKQVNVILKDLKIKHPYTSITELRKVAFRIYKENQPKKIE
jgi:hypothetical protein